MKIWYSPSMNHFYSEMVTPSYFDAERPVDPISDAVEITKSLHKKLLQELQSGRVLSHVENNGVIVPVTIEVQPEESAPTIDEVKFLRQQHYRTRVDPIANEANMERLQGNTEQASLLEKKAIEEYEKIKREYPLPQ